MKKYLLIICLLFCSVLSYSQKFSFKDEYNSLIDSLSSENWAASEKLCNKLLSYGEPIDSLQYEVMVLRYVYIYSVAGLMNDNKLSQNGALNRVKHLKGKEMIMPTHPFKRNCYVNCTNLLTDKPNTFFTTVNNSDGTKIFSFEYVTVETGVNESAAQLEGKLVTLKGILDSISVEGNLYPRFKLLFIKGGYMAMQ